jgi:hypothetical protein
MTASSLQAALRAGAQGLYVLEAAAGLIIAHGTWLARDDFRCWEAVTQALDAGELPGSAGGDRLLQLAASLAGQAPVILGDAVTGLDDCNIQMLVKDVLHASGRRQFPAAP